MLKKGIRVIAVAVILSAQLGAALPPVIIAEFMAENNGVLRDASGNSSDWLELQNTTGRAVSLLNWSLTDSASKPDKWRLPDVTLPPWGTLLVWASNADLRDPAGELHTNFALGKSGEFLGLYDASGTPVHNYGALYPQYENISYGYAFSFATNGATLVSSGSPARALCPADGALGTLWRALGFDDAAWEGGLLPAGFATKNPAWLPEVAFSLQSLAYGKPGVYLRVPFELEAAAAVQSLALELTYDDGAALFLNGLHACSANAPPFQTLSHTNYAASILGDPSMLALTDISAATNGLADGANVLAVHLLNGNASSSDLFLKPRLTAVLRSLTATNEPAFMVAATPGSRNGDEGSQRLPQTVSFSAPAGIPAAPFTLTLAGSLPGQTIRYTLNGAEPLATNGTLYAAPLPVSASLHIRARVFDALGRSGATATAQYTFCSADAATLNFATALPILVLRENDPLLNGIPSAESLIYTACSAHLIEPVGGSACLTSAPALTARAGVHVRGSSSSGFPKKPYALTFWGEDNDDRKVDISGFPKGSDFALISCYNYDRTYMHDALLFDLSRQIGRYAPRTRWVELFTIGNESDALSAARYAGLYVLEERIKAGDGRVPIDDIASPADTALPELTGSYLFKTDRNDADEFYWRTARNFPNSTGRYMVLAYPKSDTARPEQCRYIVDAFNAFEDTVYGTDPMNPTNGVARHIDLPSWVDFHIYKMFSMDVDLLTLSSWFHKDRGGKIMAGPLWDFDRSLGPYGYSEASFPNVKRWDAWTFSPEPFIRGDFWGKLHAQPAFQRLYWDRWAELRRGTWSETNLAATIGRLQAQIPEAAAERDIVKWGQRPSQQFGTTHPSEVLWLTWFVTNHAAWIDQNLYAKCSLLKAATLAPGSCARPAGSWLRVTLNAPEGNQIRYTLDGNDPALWNNQPHPSAHTCAPGTAIDLSTSALLFARAYSTADGRWGLAARAEYLIGGRHALPGDLQLSEIHYHPELSGKANHLPELGDRCYEFVEILNVAGCDISLTGCRFPEGKPADELILGPALLRPGERAVVARHREAFRERYGGAVTPVAAWSYGSLGDDGETVTLLNRDGQLLDRVGYGTADPWPASADGDGDSLNRATFGHLAERGPWQAAVPTPGRGGYWEWFGLRGIASLEGDEDGDGVANLIEYYTGADPLDPSDRGRSDMQGIQAGQDGLCIAYHQALGRPDVWALLEESEDLLEWRDTDTGALAVEATSDGYRWTFRQSPEELAEHPRRYFRLRVQPATASNSGGTLPPPL